MYLLEALSLELHMIIHIRRRTQRKLMRVQAGHRLIQSGLIVSCVRTLTQPAMMSPQQAI
nr:MAG TPA: hypothetical protein [Caudoviricetes sp.]